MEVMEATSQVIHTSIICKIFSKEIFGIFYLWAALGGGDETVMELSCPNW